MRNFPRKIIILLAVLMLLAGPFSCMPQKKAVIDKTPVNSDRLEEDRGAQLSQRALDEYRKGNLAEAISIWKSILVFDPNDAVIVKAIDTATIQMKNLQQKKE